MPEKTHLTSKKTHLVSDQKKKLDDKTMQSPLGIKHIDKKASLENNKDIILTYLRKKDCLMFFNIRLLMQCH